MAYSDVILATPGLVAYWRLGEMSGTVATDELGGHDGTYQGGPALGEPGLIDGDPDTAVELDGATQYVDLGTSAGLRPAAAVRIDLWFRKSSNADGMLYASTSEPYGFNVFYTSSGGGQIRFETDTTDDGVLDLYWNERTLNEDDLEHVYHVVCIYDGAVKTIAVDGVVGLTTQSASGTLLYGAGDNVIGAYPDLASYFFNGTIDEVALADPSAVSSPGVASGSVRIRFSLSGTVEIEEV